MLAPGPTRTSRSSWPPARASGCSSSATTTSTTSSRSAAPASARSTPPRCATPTRSSSSLTCRCAASPRPPSTCTATCTASRLRPAANGLLVGLAGGWLGPDPGGGSCHATAWSWPQALLRQAYCACRRIPTAPRRGRSSGRLRFRPVKVGGARADPGAEQPGNPAALLDPHPRLRRNPARHGENALVVPP